MNRATSSVSREFPWDRARFALWLRAMTAAGILLAATAPAARAAVEHQVIEASDFSVDEFYRARLRIQVDEAPTREILEELAEEIIDQRLARRVLHVVELLVYGPGELDHERPDGYVLWAYDGDPTRRPPMMPEHFDELMTVIEVGADAGRRAQQSPLVPRVEPTPMPEAPGAVATPRAVAPPATPTPTPTPVVVDRLPTPSPTPSRAALALPADTEQSMLRAEVLALLSRWRAAWQEKDVDRYMTFYSRRFREGDLDWSGWRERKVNVFAKAGQVEVGLSDFVVTTDAARPGRVAARFVQEYTSATVGDVGVKTLLLDREGDELKIVAETWESR